MGRRATGSMATPGHRHVMDAKTAISAARALFLAFVLVVIAAGAVLAQPKFPQLTGRVVDEAGLLTPSDRAEIEAMLRQLEERSTDQIAVYTTRSLQGYPIEDFGYQLGRAWQIGQKDKNNGIVLIVAPNERSVRIEVGRGLEPQMTDLMSGLIINNVILPAFRRGEFSAGIKAGVRDIRDVLLGDAAEVENRARGAKKRTTGGNINADTIIILIVIAFFLYVVFMQMREAQRHPKRARYRRRDGNVIVNPGGWGGSGSWPPSGGGWGGGGGGDSGGGWSGGGGDFGGGGASGKW